MKIQLLFALASSRSHVMAIDVFDQYERCYAEKAQTAVPLRSTVAKAMTARDSKLLTLSRGCIRDGNPEDFEWDTFAGHRFSDPYLLREALTPDVKTEPIIFPHKTAKEGNMRLAWVGDAVIYTILRGAWYDGTETRSTQHLHSASEAVY